jgi:predicted NAD/FAD-binding protein
MIPSSPLVAVIGAGISGLACAYHLDRAGWRVLLLEKGPRLGGHTRTVSIADPTSGQPLPIDTGFMVFNHRTYPNLCRFFADLDVPETPTDMSFSVQHLPDGLEWNGAGLPQLFAQRRNLARPRYWRFLQQLNRFNQDARAFIQQPSFLSETQTLGHYIDARGYGEDFMRWYLLPMTSAVWSTEPEQMRQFPARTLLRFFDNHGFLGLDTHFQWYTVPGGAVTYIQRLQARWGVTVRCNAEVEVVMPLPPEAGGGVRLGLSSGEGLEVDLAVLACHADEALAMLVDPSDFTCHTLGAFGYQQNHGQLHTDARVMPRRRRAWASWNYRWQAGPVADAGRASTHYWMNHLQPLPTQQPYWVSINGQHNVAPHTVLDQWDTGHPVFTPEAIVAQGQLGRLNRETAQQLVFFCGAYFKYGFHEDGYTAGMQLAQQLVATPPRSIPAQKYALGGFRDR